MRYAIRLPRISRNWTNRLRRRELILMFLAGALMIAAGLVAWSLARPATYNGKTVRTWAMLVAAPDPKVREQAQSELKRLGSSAVPVLIQMLQERDPAFRSGMWRGANHLPRSLRYMVLRNVAWTNALEVRVAAARSLTLLGHDAADAIPVLEQALYSKEVRVQLEAATALGRIGRDSIPVLMHALEEKDASIRYAAVYALGEVGPDAQPAIPLLTRALQDTDPQVRSSVAYSLSVIGSRRSPPR